MNWLTIRISIVLIGLLLPYLIRAPFGAEWLMQYTDTGIPGFLFISGLNLPTLGLLFGFSFVFRYRSTLIIPCLIAFGLQAIGHGELDLSSDAQASLALIILPLITFIPTLISLLICWLVEYLVSRSKQAKQQQLN